MKEVKHCSRCNKVIGNVWWDDWPSYGRIHIGCGSQLYEKFPVSKLRPLIKDCGQQEIVLEWGNGYKYKNGNYRLCNNCQEGFLKNIGLYLTNSNNQETGMNKSLDDKIKELKELAKSQGMDCDVVLSEKKKVEVNWDGGNIQNKSFYFIYDKSVEELLIKTGFSKAGEFLAKQLEKYLNQE